MKKVINITIGQVVFSVEEDAYDKLSQYLEGIKKHFAKDNDRDEILEDIEVGIAEKFLKRRKKKGSAVSLQEVEKVIEQMGTLQDFKKEESDEKMQDTEEDKGNVRHKKLYRNPDDAIIGGVASGLAAYFGLETIIVRLIFFVTLFFGGLGAVIYIFLWIVLPAAQTTEQKFEMRGERMTLQEIEKAVKEGVDKLKKKDYKKVNGFFRSLWKTLSVIFLSIIKITGGALVLAGILGICALSFSFAWANIAPVHVNSIPIYLTDFVALEGPLYWLFAVALPVSILIPFLFILLLGLSIFKMKPVASFFKWLILFIVWFIALGFAGSIIFQNHARIEQKIWDIHHLISVQEEQHFFEDCFRSGGVPFVRDGRRVCDLIGTFEDGSLKSPLLYIEDLNDEGDCQSSVDCQLPPEVSALSSCSIPPYCGQNNKCMYGCPLSPIPEDSILPTRSDSPWPDHEEKMDQSCQTSADCELPMEYAVRSICPYLAVCEENTCVVRCPLWDEAFTSDDQQ